MIITNIRMGSKNHQEDLIEVAEMHSSSKFCIPPRKKMESIDIIKHYDRVFYHNVFTLMALEIT